MTCRVIHAHPVSGSFSAALCDAVADGVRDGGIEPVVTHLGPDGSGPDAAALTGTDALHLVYPTWWGGPPAEMLDWIQRILGPWVDGPSRDPSPLAAVTTLTAVTTHGSSALVNRLQGEPGRQLVTRVVAPLCHPDVEVEWIALYAIEATDRTAREAFLDRARRSVSLTSGAARR